MDMTHIKAADRLSLPCISFNNLELLSLSVAFGPAYRAERTPGAPPKASTSRPESSAMAGKPSAFAVKEAFLKALSSKVSPSSSTSDRVPKSSRFLISTGKPSKRSLISFVLPRFLVARTSHRFFSIVSPKSGFCHPVHRQLHLGPFLTGLRSAMGRCRAKKNHGLQWLCSGKTFSSNGPKDGIAILRIRPCGANGNRSSYDILRLLQQKRIP